MLPELEALSHKERMDRLELFFPGVKEAESDMIEIYKIIRGKDRIVRVFVPKWASKTKR